MQPVWRQRAYMSRLRGLNAPSGAANECNNNKYGILPPVPPPAGMQTSTTSPRCWRRLAWRTKPTVMDGGWQQLTGLAWPPIQTRMSKSDFGGQGRAGQAGPGGQDRAVQGRQEIGVALRGVALHYVAWQGVPVAHPLPPFPPERHNPLPTTSIFTAGVVCQLAATIWLLTVAVAPLCVCLCVAGHKT
jgi:hypothetical protein